MERYTSMMTAGWKIVRKSMGFLLVFAAFESQAMAVPVLPEIDPGSMSSGLALLAGGMLLLTDRLRRK